MNIKEVIGVSTESSLIQYPKLREAKHWSKVSYFQQEEDYIQISTDLHIAFEKSPGLASGRSAVS